MYGSHFSIVFPTKTGLSHIIVRIPSRGYGGLSNSMRPPFMNFRL